MKLEFHDLAMKFVREHKFSMTVQDVESAMEIGASEAIKQASELIKKERIEMGNFRRRNNSPK